MNNKLIVIGVGIALFILIIFVASPYSQNWRSHLSSIYETAGDSMSINNPNEAVKEYNKALFIYQSDNLRYKIGRLYHDSNKSKKSERYFKTIKNEKFKKDIANLYLKKGDTVSADKYLSNIQATDDVLYLQLISTLSKDSNTSLFDCLEKPKCLELSKKTTIITNSHAYRSTAIADVLNNEGYDVISLNIVDSITEKNRDSHIFQARILIDKGNYEEAVKSLLNAVKIDPYYVESSRLLKICYNELRLSDKLEDIEKKIDNYSLEEINF